MLEHARKQLLDPKTSALSLYQAALAFYGPTAPTYEPETLWSLEPEVPAINRDKLLAALTLQRFPAFYWDIRVFGYTVLAFNDQAAHTELTPQPLPEHIVWGVYEAQKILQHEPDGTTSDVEPTFDDEVAAFVAACLAHEGLTYAPPLLAFAAEHLAPLLSPAGRKLGERVKAAAGEENPQSEPGSALEVQLARYVQIGEYLQMRVNVGR